MCHGRKVSIRQTGLPFKVVRNAYVNLLPNELFEEGQLPKVYSAKPTIPTEFKHNGRRPKGTIETQDGAKESKGADNEGEASEEDEPNPLDPIILPVVTRALLIAGDTD